MRSICSLTVALAGLAPTLMSATSPDAATPSIYRRFTVEEAGGRIVRATPIPETRLPA